MSSPVPRKVAKNPSPVPAEADLKEASTPVPSDDTTAEGEEGSGLTAAQARQLDREARWVKRSGQSTPGYKRHVVTDTEHKFIWYSC